jgi:uncharacterized membrane protein YqaE (UPF0057 family)
VILLAIFFPPLAIFLCGKPIQGLINLLVYLAAWFGLVLFVIPGVIAWAIACAHACYVVQNRKADRRTQKITDAIVASALIKQEEKMHHGQQS